MSFSGMNFKEIADVGKKTFEFPKELKSKPMFDKELRMKEPSDLPQNGGSIETKKIETDSERLTAKQYERISIETGWPPEIINSIENWAQYSEVYKDAGLHAVKIDGRWCLVNVTLPDAKTYENVAKTDDNGTVYLKDGELEPNTTYELNGNTYTTDEQSRIIRCEATPERSPENPRDVNAQLQAGGEDRRPSDQGGHIVGRDLNGDGGAGNLVAMDSKINQSDYKRMENDIKAALDEGKDVSVTTDISYSGDSKRPDTITVTVTADGVKTVYKFDNNLDGGLKDEVPENGKDAVQEELNDTNGEISSIKEEYNENGELTETTVNITYTDENGTNHRTKVYIDAE